MHFSVDTSIFKEWLIQLFCLSPDRAWRKTLRTLSSCISLAATSFLCMKHAIDITHNIWSEAIRLRKSGDKSRKAAGGLEWVKQNISICERCLTASNCTVMIFWFILQGRRIAITLYQQVQKLKEKYILKIVKDLPVLYKISFGVFLNLC